MCQCDAPYSKGDMDILRKTKQQCSLLLQLVTKASRREQSAEATRFAGHIYHLVSLPKISKLHERNWRVRSTQSSHNGRARANHSKVIPPGWDTTPLYKSKQHCIGVYGGHFIFHNVQFCSLTRFNPACLKYFQVFFLFGLSCVQKQHTKILPNSFIKF